MRVGLSKIDRRDRTALTQLSSGRKQHQGYAFRGDPEGD
jgi:hypothetical protein